jgi:hypothetical protein
MLVEVWMFIPTEKQKDFMLDADQWFKTQPDDQKKVIVEMEFYRDSDK